MPYDEVIKKAYIDSFERRKLNICRDFFLNMQIPDNVLFYLMPNERDTRYGLRKAKKYDLPKCKTIRFKNTLITFSLYNFQ